MRRIGFVVGEVAFLAVAFACGGPPWTLVGGAAFILLGLAGPQVATLVLAAPSLAWLGAALVTGNRELFFPYAMQLAAVVICRVAERGIAWSFAGGGLVAATFLAIRVAQQATPRVLAVECGVAVAILAAAAVARAKWPQGGMSDAVVVASSALLAYAGLAL